MARIFLSSNLTNTNSEQLPAALQTLFQQLEDQVNQNTDVVSLTENNQTLPEGIRIGDIIFSLKNNEVKVGIFNGKEPIYASFGTITGEITDGQHGTRSGGNLHPDATTSISGFMSGADKTKVNKYKGDTSSGAPASTTEYPADGDYGFHTDTVGLTYNLAKNKAGTIYTSLLT